MPLIIMLILTIIIPTIIYVGKSIIQQPTETAKIEKQEDTNEEKISAETVTVNAGDSYTVPRDGVYKIELHGGKSADIELDDGTKISGNKGSKVTGYVRLNKGDVLATSKYEGGMGPIGFEGSLGQTSYYSTITSLNGADGLSVSLNGYRLGVVSRGPWFLLRLWQWLRGYVR